jgi:putative aldouronate transport system permease protein
MDQCRENRMQPEKSIVKEKSISSSRLTSHIKVYKKSPIRRFVYEYITKDIALHCLILIPLIYIVIFKYYPMYGAQIAFRDFSPTAGITGSEWVGLKYFEKFFKSYLFRRIIVNTVTISVYSIIAGFPVPILLALSLNAARSMRFKKTVQMVTYAPYFISTVVIVGIVIQFLSPTIGLYGKISTLLGKSANSPLGDPNMFSSIYVWSGIWQGMGWNSIIYISALSTVDPTFYEAAEIDGASILQKIRYIEIPAIMPTIVIILIMSMGSIMDVGFEKVYLLQNPLNQTASEVIQTYVYKLSIANSIPDYSYAASIGLFSSVINFILIFLVNKVAQKLGNTSLW